MRVFTRLLVLLPSVYSLTIIPRNTQHCASFAETAPWINNVRLINSTLIPPNDLNLSNTLNAHPFCRVLGQVSYGNNDTLNFELWLPDPESYNGRFMAVGNGGMAGTIDTNAMLTHLNSGFATAGSDAGHLASLNNAGAGAPNVYLPYLHDPDQVKAWIHTGISLFALPIKKALLRAYYGHNAKYTYYNGCSTGGAQGFALAELYPDLFDGIVAGSPGNWYSHLALSFLWNDISTQNASFLPLESLELVTGTVLEVCDGLDGVVDGVIENPLRCAFDVASLACEYTDEKNGSECLTEEQVEAAKAIYGGPRSRLDGSEIYPGFSVGSEREWGMQEGVLANAFSIPILQNLVKNNLAYDYRRFDFGEDVKEVDERAGRYIDEIATDLSAFRDAGAKLMVTQGWADPYNAALWPIQHKQNIEAFLGCDISDFFALFMVPGGGHCGVAASYPGVPATYHTIEKLVAWVERGEVPEGVVSTDPPDGSESSRLLCPWPETARFVGGDVGDWRSYVCGEW